MSDREERDDFIRREYGQKRLTASQIGEALGMPRNSVISRARVLGLHKPCGTDGHHKMMSEKLSGNSNRLGTGRAGPKEPRPVKAPPEPAERLRDPGRLVWNNKTTLQERSRPGETLRVVEAVAARMAPKGRLCAWRTYEGEGRSMPCCESAQPGHMWCEGHLKQVAELKESA